jgi:hypothetical protein
LIYGNMRIGVEMETPLQRKLYCKAKAEPVMDDARIPAIFEAAFEYDGARIRVDVMERLASDAWGLREVKSCGGLKDYYLDDIALQAFVLRGTGITVCSIELLHVNTAYVRGLMAFAGRISLPAWMSAALSPGGLSICRPIF